MSSGEADASAATVDIVDDDPGVREALRVLLRFAGLRTRVFGSAEEYLEAPPVEGPSCSTFSCQARAGSSCRRA
jgi:FixJ family two-component response regulator